MKKVAASVASRSSIAGIGITIREVGGSLVRSRLDWSMRSRFINILNVWRKI